jgi:hypothetical protein
MELTRWPDGLPRQSNQKFKKVKSLSSWFEKNSFPTLTMYLAGDPSRPLSISVRNETHSAEE